MISDTYNDAKNDDLKKSQEGDPHLTPNLHKRKRGRPPKPKNPEVIVQRPVNNGTPVKPDTWDGRFKSVEPMKWQRKPKNHNYKWNHNTTINWIMGQADPLGFLTDVMSGKEIFPVYIKSPDGTATPAGKISADPELRVMAAKTLLGKCVPDLKAVEVHAQVEQTKVLDIGRLNDDDLNTIELALKHAVIDTGGSGEDEEVTEGVYQELLADD
jgi:hypothetical protein